MPLQNRVSATGSIERSNARGTLMGNRGVLHNSKKEVVHQFRNKAWITCLLEFKGRQRQLMSPGAYTELFFLDEVTAFAAGHRPCAECRRKNYNDFRASWSVGNKWDGGATVRAPEIDSVMHEERIEGGKKLTWKGELAELPHGAMFQVDGETYAVCDGVPMQWSFDGYREAAGKNFPNMVDVLTPHSVVSAFSAGYRPEFHSSAFTMRG